ncbi:hypothetical protein QE152_g13015 [Popillia japonica]|uniref:SPEF2 C-terminal domain-containing protein n=1 Tax=Popillia japonica TaxID=7064 RepID=A0AAW1LE32_POPJA
MPCPDDVMQKIMLEYITFNDKFEFENLHVYSKFVRNVLTQGLHVYSKFVRNVLTQGDAITNDSPFHKVMNNNHSEAMRAAEHYKQTSMNILSNMEAYFQPKGKKGTTAKREIKGKGKALPKFSAPEPAVKDVGLKLIEEWRCAVEGEYARSGQKCCDILCRAVEEEMAIQPELVLKGDKFYVNPDVLLFEDSLPEPEPILKEYEAPGIFTIVQLSDLTSILLDLAPKGIMPERAFTFLLQDLIVYNADDGRPSVVPPLWTQLPLRNVNKLMDTVASEKREQIVL